MYSLRLCLQVLRVDALFHFLRHHAESDLGSLSWLRIQVDGALESEGQCLRCGQPEADSSRLEVALL